METDGLFKKRLAWVLASLFIVWHIGALIIAPLPSSYASNKMYKWYKPYLTLLNINNGWAFFAPNPHTGVRMFYILRNAAGEEQKIDFTSQLHRQTTEFQRFTMMQDHIWLNASPYSQSAAEFLCRRHEGFSPVTVAFEFHRAKMIQPEEYLQGQRTHDKENLIIEAGSEFSCLS